MRFIRKFQYACICISLLVATSTVIAAEHKVTDSSYDLTILHMNDHHSHVEPSTMDLTLAGETTRTKIGGFAEIAALVKEQQAMNPDALLLHGGDAITGTIYYSLFKGKSDAAVMNQLEWDAFVLGNHEFDDGDEVLATFLDALNAPTVAANVVPPANNVLAGKWEPYIITNVKGRDIGIIGIDIVGKTKNSSSPSPEIEFFDEVETAEKYTDELTKKGVDIVIVLTHIGQDNARMLASKVSGVDVVVTADSHTLLGGQEIRKIGLNPKASYPEIIKDPDGNPVVVVQAWEYAKVLGIVDITFDKKGIVQEAHNRSIFPLADTFLRKNSDGDRVEVEGAARDAIYTDIDTNPALQLVKTPDAATSKIIASYKEEKEKIGKIPIGNALENISGGSSLRIPSVDGVGHETAQLVAKASLYTLQNLFKGKVDALIQNAGGVRIPIAQGEITTETIYTLLPFSNTLITIEMTGAEVKSALEDSIDYAFDPQGSTGAFPYTASMRYTADFSMDKGNRVSQIELEKDGKWVPIDMGASYIIGANSYIAGGKDGYITLGNLDDGKKVNTYLEYAQVVIDYIKKVKEISKPDSISVTVKK